MDERNGGGVYLRDYEVVYLKQFLKTLSRKITCDAAIDVLDALEFGVIVFDLAMIVSVG